MNIVILKLLSAAFCGFMTWLLLSACYNRIKGTLESTDRFNKQQYVQQNRNVFGIKDRECSEIKEVFVVSPERLGL